jgi:hypothetical protein
MMMGLPMSDYNFKPAWMFVKGFLSKDCFRRGGEEDKNKDVADKSIVL